MCDSCRDFFVFFSFKLFSFDASFSFNLLMITGTPNVSWASVNELPFELGELITIVWCYGCSLCLFDGCETVFSFSLRSKTCLIILPTFIQPPNPYHFDCLNFPVWSLSMVNSLKTLQKSYFCEQCSFVSFL